ncbi:hypothetical protein E1B28_002287 [Marasmius oreades]|uniref:Sulfotransferase n=1 Tax=Marasmius oreades TaxID=181124 RepID=A0A9P7RMC6_9AGAR|nr:uncharacterized protein E1B28_002287 [Marasmius oreades]KAG7086324.1 hypothetical protein E1B28_002287 [Marasmius oreades]
MAVETQFKWQRMVYNCYKGWYASNGINSKFPVVIDGDKLVNETREQMEKLCEMLGLDVSNTRYSWDATKSFPNIAYEYFGGTIGRSTGVIRKEESVDAPVLDDEMKKWAEEWDDETASLMRRYTEKAMPDFQFLLARSI